MDFRACYPSPHSIGRGGSGRESIGTLDSVLNTEPEIPEASRGVSITTDATSATFKDFLTVRFFRTVEN